MAKDYTSADVAILMGYSRTWIDNLVKQYNQGWLEALGDRRRDNSGQETLLNDVQQAQLWQVLKEPPADGNLWDGPKVAQWMSDVLGRTIHPQ